MAVAQGRTLLALAIGTCVVALLAASGATVEVASEGCCGWSWDLWDREPDPLVADVPQPVSEPRLTASGSFGSAVLELLLHVALVLAAAGIVFLLGRAVWRTLRAVEVEPLPDPSAWELAAPTGRDELAEAVELGLAELPSGPVGDAIVACWVRLEAAAAAAGVARRPWETPTELTERVLGEVRVPTGSTLLLLELYRTARYSVHDLGEAERREAIAALQEIGQALAQAQARPR